MIKYRSEIDGLRALAVMPVIFFHAGFKSFSGGFVGVDVFFVISGYLITTILINDLKAGRFSILHFYERRARRILPALFFVIIACLPFAWLWLPLQDLKRFSQSLIAVSVFASNILFWRTSGYFDTATELKPLIHTWSLSVEEQYYLLFPLLLLFTWRLDRRWIIISLSIITAISIICAQYFSINDPSLGFYLLPTRAWELMIGAFVAFYYTEHNINKHKYLHAESGSLIGLLLILYSVINFNNKTPFPSLYALLPTCGAALIIIYATHKTLVGKILSSKIFVAVGLISYSAYLWHQPLFSFARHHSMGEPSVFLMSSLAIASFPLAYFTWKYIERPFRNKHHFTRAQVFIYATTGSFIFISIGLAGHLSNGFYKLKTTSEQQAVLDTSTTSPKRADCHTGGSDYRKPSASCEYLTGTLRVATFGDSHTVELAYALAESLVPYNIKIKHFSFSGCAPMYGRKDKDRLPYCTYWTNDSVDYIIKDTNIDIVIVSYRIHAALNGDHSRVYPKIPDGISKNERELRWASFIALLDKFAQSGKKVILVMQAPELPKPLDYLLMKSERPLEKIDGVYRKWWDKRTDYVTSRLSQIPKNIDIIDPAKLFCDDVICLAADQGKAFYFDDNHLSVEGARMVSNAIIDILGEKLKISDSP